MTLLDDSLKKVFSRKAKFGSKELQNVVDLLSNSINNLEDSNIVKQPSLLHEIILNSLTNQSSDFFVLSAAYVITTIINTNKLLKLGEKDAIEILLIRLHQIYQKKTSSIQHKIIVLEFISALTINVLDKITMSTIASLFSIISWKGVNLNYIDSQLLDEFKLKQLYEKETQKLTTLSPKEKNTTLILSQWIPSIIDELLSLDLNSSDNINLAISIISLISLILSQLPTRRFFKTIVDQKHLLFHLKKLTINDPKLLCSIDTLEYFINFPINEFSGLLKTIEETNRQDTQKVEYFQSILFENFKDKLETLIFSSTHKLRDSNFVQNELQALSNDELDQVLSLLNLQSNDLKDTHTKVQLITFSLQQIPNLYNIYLKWKPIPSLNTLDNIDESFKTLLPSLSSMNLSINDLLLRHYQNLRITTFIDLSNHLERVINRFEKKKNQTKIVGNSRHSIKLADFKPEKDKNDGTLRVNIKLNINNQDETTIKEWNQLKKGDYVFVIKLTQRDSSKSSRLSKLGTESIETSEIVDVLNNNGTPKTNDKSKSFSLNLRIDDDTSTTSSETEVLLVKIPTTLNNALKNLKNYIGLNDYNLEDSIPDWLSQILLTYQLPKHETIDKGLESERNVKKRKVIDGEGEVAGDETETIVNKQASLLDDSQSKALFRLKENGFNIIDGISGSGKRFIVKTLVDNLIKQNPNEKILIISKNKSILTRLFEQQFNDPNSSDTHFNLSDNDDIIRHKFNNISERLHHLLQLVDSIASSLGLEGAYGNDTETALNFFKYEVRQRWVNYLTTVSKSRSLDDVIQLFPFANIEGFKPHDTSLGISENLEISINNYIIMKNIFAEISKLRPLEFLSSQDDRTQYLLESQANVIGITTDDTKLVDYKGFETVIFLDADELNVFETLGPVLNDTNDHWTRFILVGDSTKTTHQTGHNLFGKLISRNDNFVHLKTIHNQREIISETIDPSISVSSPNIIANAGIFEPSQIIELESEEIENVPNVFQNVTEAEFSVLLYKYFSLIGYPASSIAILTQYEGQRMLLEDVFSELIGGKERPVISTIDGFKVEKSDIIIFSFTRTGSDVKLDSKPLKRLLSYARLGIYGIASPSILKHLKHERLLEPLVNQSSVLKIVKNERFGESTRNIDDNTTETIDIKSVKVLESLITELEGPQY